MSTARAANETTDEDDAHLGAALCRAAGRALPTALLRLAGGRNNRVVRLDLADGSRAVLKRYHHDPRDPRDRLAAEWAFLEYAADRGIDCVPTPLARDASVHAALYTFADGRKLAAGEIGDSHVAQALAFVRRLNSAPREPLKLAPGSEACFSLTDHIATVDRRVARLDALDPGAPLAGEAMSFVTERLRPVWQIVKANIERGARKANFEFDATLPAQEMCVSPSDFGFHNALVKSDGRATFIDFEYGGRDDPAKLVCDFFCQPELPVPIAQFDGFAAGVADALGLGSEHFGRMQLLLDAYRIKWICIMLNEFLALDAARRAFADQGARGVRCREQLDKVSAALAAVSIRLN